MKSKKDQGNEYFKKEKYQQAIECYNEYVRLDHSDNSKAYSNMALSYFRLKKYEECVKACESAVEIEPQNEKAQFRMFEAYKELKDNYGMLIAAQKFCKLSKDEKEITPIQKLLPKVKEELSYGVRKDITNLESDKIILQIVNQLKDTSDIAKPKKQPLICLDAKWYKIQQLAKQNRRLALNQARRFLNQQCKTQQEKQHYKKLIPKLSMINQTNQIPKDLKEPSDQTESSEEEIKIQELKKYTEEQQKKAKQAQEKAKAKTTIKNEPVREAVKIKEQKVVSEAVNSKEQKAEKQHSPKQQPAQKQLNGVQEIKPQQQKPKQQPVKNPQPQGKWEDFIKQEQAQNLFQVHIQQKMKKCEDQFVGLYECLSNLLRSTELDRFQKEAILSLTPTKLKKFNMLMKSYTGKEKQDLAQLFTQNNLHTVMEKYSLKK